MSNITTKDYKELDNIRHEVEYLSQKPIGEILNWAETTKDTINKILDNATPTKGEQVDENTRRDT